MKKLFFLLFFVVLLGSSVTKAADVTLSIVVPNDWVAPTIAAIKDKWPVPTDWYPGESEGVRIKLWTEHRIRVWLRNIVAPYKSELDKTTVLTTGGYVSTADEDIPIEISQ